MFQPGDKVYLDADDIQTTRPSKKLAHQRLGPYAVEKQVNPNAYWLKLPCSMNCLHPVFNVVKLTPAPEDPIATRRTKPPPDPILVNNEEEWEVEEILDSRFHRRRLQYLIKWKGFGTEHNSWEAVADVKAPELVNEFYRKNPGAPRQIRTLAFDSIPFRGLTPDVSRRHDLEGGVDVRGTTIFPQRPTPPTLRPDSSETRPSDLTADTNPDWRARGTMGRRS